MGITNSGVGGNFKFCSLCIRASDPSDTFGRTECTGWVRDSFLIGLHPNWSC
jgi:hypothetical protein